MEKTWHYIIEKCDCERSEIPVYDELGEDCNAYEEMEKMKQESEACNVCGKKPRFFLVRTKN